LKRALIAAIILTIGASVWAASPAITNGVHPGLFELGLNIGQPSGISLKVWIDKNGAVEGLAAWDFNAVEFVASLDYLFTFPDILKLQTTSFPLFVGVGGFAQIGTGSTPTIGLRVPLGILFVFARAPIEIQLDVVPGMTVYPATKPVLMGGFAIRYCFGG